MSKKQNLQTMAELLARSHLPLRGLKKGEEVEGRITAISPKGIYLDINGKTEGVVLEKDKRILKSLLQSLRVGDVVRASVLNPESEEGYAVFSLRRQHKVFSWQQLIDAKTQDKPVEVTVVDITRNGALVDFNGLRGFIPSSHLHLQDNTDLVGKKISVKVLEALASDNRLIFSQKALALSKKELERELSDIKINDKFAGTVTGITKFGIFVNIGGNIEGLVHISEISWEKVSDLERQFKIGDKVQVSVIGVDPEKLRLNLSIKQLAVDPWLEVSRRFAKEQEVQGKVSKITRGGIFVSLDGIDGFIHKSKIPLGQEFEEQDKVTCVIESIDSSKRRINLVPVFKEKPIGYK